MADWTSLLTPEETADLDLLGIDWQARIIDDLANIARLSGLDRKKAFSVIGVDAETISAPDQQAIIAAAKTAAEDVADVILVKITSICPVDKPETTKPYSFNLTASGGDSPYAWALAGGLLPKGIAVLKPGTIEGIAAEIGVFEYIFTVTDSKGRVDKMACTMIVDK